ncbi:AAA family ATPase [Actinopolymorpha sp. NPDC004070]|uniref:AAA family ATPase n=1 Tax=Actinopolymorpha sp. NPDC004070 TaxID=3154548 RepID=UPI00339F0729
MDLVYLYGPPAVGKLTVARELAARTGYRVFHNHLAIDCVRPVFEFGSEPFWRQVHAIREGILAEAARAGRDLISTTVYSHPDCDPQTRRRFEAVEGNGGRVCPVRLTCSTKVLETRVTDTQRKAAGKLATIDGLHRAMAEHDLFTPIPWREGLQLDTGILGVAETAQRIIAGYRLPVLDQSGC